MTTAITAMLGYGNKSIRYVNLVSNDVLDSAIERCRVLSALLRRTRVSSITAESHGGGTIDIYSEEVSHYNGHIDIAATYFDIGGHSGAHLTFVGKDGYWLKLLPLKDTGSTQHAAVTCAE